MAPRQEDPTNHRTRSAAKTLGAAAAIAPLLVAGAHADDVAAKTFKVKNTKSNGKGSLNKAIKKANRNKNADRIIFRSRLSGDIKVRRGGKKRRLQVTDPIKIVGNGRRGLALKGATKGSLLKFKDTRKSSIKGLKLKAVSIRASHVSGSPGLRITSSTLDGKGIDAAGVSAYYADVNISRSTIKRFSRGVAINQSRSRIDRSTVAKNAPRQGVGVFNGHVEIAKSTISGNSFTGEGGADTVHGGGVMAGYYASANISNSTISSNYSSGAGGGIWGDIDVSGSTITANESPLGGGIYATEFYGPVKVSDSIVAGNSAAVGDDCSGEVKSKGSNVFGAQGCGASPQPSDILTGAPGLQPLADNGGRTKTHALSANSPAINHAPSLDLKTDQRGVRRGKHPDSGSFER